MLDVLVTIGDETYYRQWDASKVLMKDVLFMVEELGAEIEIIKYTPA